MLAVLMWHTLLKLQEVWAEIRKGPERFPPWRAGGDKNNTVKVLNLMKNKSIKEFKLTRKKVQEGEGY